MCLNPELHLFGGEVAFARTMHRSSRHAGHLHRKDEERSLQRGEAPARMVTSGTHVSELRNTSPLPRGAISLASRCSRELLLGSRCGPRNASTRVHCEPRHLAAPAVRHKAGPHRSPPLLIKRGAFRARYPPGEFPGHEKYQRKVLAGSTRSGGRSLTVHSDGGPREVVVPRRGRRRRGPDRARVRRRRRRRGLLPGEV